MIRSRRRRQTSLASLATVATLAFLAFTTVSLVPSHAQAPDWRTTVQQELPLLGHRNWIVIVDSAYPLQSSPGVETLETGASQEEVVRSVLKSLATSTHVAPDVFMDAELPFVPEQKAPGVAVYRKSLPEILGKLPVQSLPHEELIKMLGESGKTFHVLILKTTMTIPYTSVFLRLGCKYWDDASEQELRRAMKQNPPPHPTPAQSK